MTARLALCIALALVVSACDSEPIPIFEPEVVEKVETCDEIIPVYEELVRRMFEAVEGAPIDVVTGDAPPSEELIALSVIGDNLDEKAARLSCDPAAVNAEVVEATQDLESADPVAQIFLDIVRSGVVGTLPAPPATTAPGG